MPVLSIRVSREQQEQLESEARKNGLTPSQYVRLRVFGDAATMPTTPSAYAALASRVEVVENALRMSGLDDAIEKAQAMLGREGSTE